MKKHPFWIILFILIIGAIIIRVLFFSKDVAKPSGNPNSARANSTSVSGIVAAGSTLDEIIYASGTVLANEEVTLHPETSGRITMLAIKEGTKVNKGDLLVKINDSDLQSQIRKLNGQLKLIEDKSDREKALLALNGISKEAYDEGQNQVSTIKADIEFTRSQIEKTEIRAPFSGQVGLRYISEGSAVTPADMIATIRQLNPVKIDFSVPEKYSGMIVVGDSISFHVDGTIETFSGKIYAMEPGIDAATRTLKVRALSDNSKNKIIPGAFARISILLHKNNSALLIPTQAIIPVLKGKKVFVVENGKAISKMIQTGIRQDKLIEITDGIQTGDTVITSGIMQLKDSMSVKVAVQ